MSIGLKCTYEYLKPMQPILMHIKSRKFMHDGFDMQWVISNLLGLVKCDPIVFFFVNFVTYMCCEQMDAFCDRCLYCSQTLNKL